MLQRFIYTHKLLFQNAIMHGIIKPAVMEIALNSIKSSAIRVIILGQGKVKKMMHISVKKNG